MGLTKLLQIVLGEFETEERKLKILYHDLFKHMWKQGIAGATVFRSTEGIGADNTFRMDLLEDIQFNDLPIKIEVIDNHEVIEKVARNVKEKIPHGEISVIPAYKVLEDEFPSENPGYLMLKIYLKENSKWFNIPLYRDILSILNDHHIIWSTVWKGIEGFGKDHIIHKTPIFSLSSQAPVIIEAVGTAKAVRSLIPELQKKVKEGMVVAIPCEVILDK